MRIFVSGASGVLGRRVVPLLRAAGHEVSGAARDPGAAERVAAAGAEPVTVDLSDGDGMARALRGHDAVINVATRIPPPSRAWRAGAWGANDRLRQVASHRIARAAARAGLRRLVQESFVLVYAPAGDASIDESMPTAPPEQVVSALDAEAAAAGFTDGDRSGVALRFAYFLAPGSAHTEAQLAAARRGLSPTISGPDDFMPTVHIDDAATAVVAALELPSGVYNVSDDDPLRCAEHDDVLAAALGRGRLLGVLRTVGRVGPMRAQAGSWRLSNRKLRATGWAPAYPSAREAWPAVIGAEVVASA